MLILIQLLELLLLMTLLIFKNITLPVAPFIILAFINILACYFSYRYRNINPLVIVTILFILNIGISYQIYYNFKSIINKLSTILVIVSILTLLFIYFYPRIKRLVVKLAFHPKFRIYLMIMIVLIFMCLLILGSPVDDKTSNWINIIGYSIQLTEFIKPLVIAFMISLLIDQSDDINKLSYHFWIMNLILITGFGLIRELGTLVILILYEFIFFMLFARKLFKNIMITLVTNKYLLIGILLIIALIIILYLCKVSIIVSLFTKISERFLGLLAPENHQSSLAFQTIKAKEALALSSPFGLNYKLSLINGHTDLAFVGLCLHLGAIVAFLMILAYQYLIYDSFNVISQNKSIPAIIYFSCFYFFAFTSMIMILINLGVLPMMGLTINLLSYGGTAYLFSFIYLTLARLIRRDLNVS